MYFISIDFNLFLSFNSNYLKKKDIYEMKNSQELLQWQVIIIIIIIIIIMIMMITIMIIVYTHRHSLIHHIFRIKILFIYLFIHLLFFFFYVVPLALERKIKDIFNDISQDHYYNNNK